MDAKDKKECNALLKKMVGSKQIRPELARILILAFDLEEPKFNKEDRTLPNWKRGDE